MKTHFRVMQILSFVLAGLNLLWGLVFSVYFICFGAMAAGAPAPGGAAGGPGPMMPLVIIMIMFGGVGLLTLTGAVLNLMAGFNYGRGTKRGLLLTAAIVNLVPGISCMYILGIPLGVYGLVMLNMPEAKQVFAKVAAGGSFEKAVDDRRGGKPMPAGDDNEIDVESGGWDETKR